MPGRGSPGMQLQVPIPLGSGAALLWQQHSSCHPKTMHRFALGPTKTRLDTLDSAQVGIPWPKHAGKEKPCPHSPPTLSPLQASTFSTP